MLTLYHDYTSPAAAVAVLRLQRLVDGGLPVAFVGFDVLGLDRALPVTLAMLVELDEQRAAAADLGLELRRPRRCPPTLGAHVLGELAEAHDLGASWRDRAYRGMWEQGVDLGDATALIGLATTAGLDEDAAGAALGEGERRRSLRRHMLEARTRGVGGVPVLAAQGTFVSPFLAESDLQALADLAG